MYQKQNLCLYRFGRSQDKGSLPSLPSCSCRTGRSERDRNIGMSVFLNLEIAGPEGDLRCDNQLERSTGNLQEGDARGDASPWEELCHGVS